MTSPLTIYGKNLSLDFYIYKNQYNLQTNTTFHVIFFAYLKGFFGILPYNFSNPEISGPKIFNTFQTNQTKNIKTLKCENKKYVTSTHPHIAL